MDSAAGSRLAKLACLRFVPIGLLEADDYQIGLEVKSVEGAEPLRKTKSHHDSADCR